MTAQTRSSKAEARTQAQRERILSAAQQCFIEHGFHAAGMAKIAETAGMSPGLIYRYFESKSAIIQAIVDRQLELLREDIRLTRQIDLAEELSEGYGTGCVDGGRRISAPLVLELSAEATRDPAIAASVRNFDTGLRQALQTWLARPKEEGGHALPAAITPARALILQMLFEGLRVRETREPDLDPDLLLAALHEFIPHLLAP